MELGCRLTSTITWKDALSLSPNSRGAGPPSNEASSPFIEMFCAQVYVCSVRSPALARLRFLAQFLCLGISLWAKQYGSGAGLG